jgi:serine/threonine-protein kinase
LLYVANSDPPPYSSVSIYNPLVNDPTPTAVITKGLLDPVGGCIDSVGTLYVTNEPGSGLGWVSEYALGETKPLRTITEGFNIPAFCAIDSQGNLWVANIGGPTITEYVKGSAKPHTTLRNGLTNPDGIAIDHVGNIYVGNNGASGGNSNVVVFPPGSKSPSRTITDGVTWPAGIAVDANGTLYVTNYLQCNIEEYLAGKSEPYRTITKDINAAVDVTFARDGWMYEVSLGNQSCNGPYPVILEFRPGSVKPSSRMVSQGLRDAIGVAYYPPLLP